MHTRNFVFITVLVLCHWQLAGQVLTNALPPQLESSAITSSASPTLDAQLPEDPSQELLPVANPEPAPAAGVPVQLSAEHQAWQGDTWTGTGGVELHYRDYTLRADKVVYHRNSSVLEADGHLQVTGGPDDAYIEAARGDVRLNMHTARFYNVNGSMGVRRGGRSVVYSTTNPFLFSGRVLLQTGEASYKVIDGTMTNCRLPRPDWQLISHAISVANGRASASNLVFKLFGAPIFYLPYLRHPVEDTGRQSGLLIPVVSNSSIKGFILGEQVYIVLNRSMDMVIGSEFYSKRGFAPNGDFRYKGSGLNNITVRWNALLDRGIQATPPATELINQGGEDITATGRIDLSPDTRIAANIEYLSSYIYKLVFNDNYTQAVSSEVHSSLSITHIHNSLVPSAYAERLQTFASSNIGDEARILHLPSLRFDAVDQPLGLSPFYWGIGSSVGRLSRSEFGYHARNIGRVDLHPHLSMPIVGGGWSIVPEVALRETLYTGSQTPDLAGTHGGTPFLNHQPLNRTDLEAAIDLRPPAIERDFSLHHGEGQMRHVIEPEFTYRFVGGIGSGARNVPLVDLTDIATNTNEVGFSLTQRFYVRSTQPRRCNEEENTQPGICPTSMREWASWKIAQKYFIDPKFGGALIPGRRNVFDSTLDLSGIAFLTVPRNLSPITSRLRFEAIENLRIEWDMDYDPRGGRLGADNLYAGYSWGRTTLGLGRSLLNAVDEQGSAATTIQSQQLQPFLSIGKPNAVGFNLAANGGYDFVHGALQYAGVQAVYNWNCCGLSIGYRRFALGSVRDETQYLYSFTLANFGSVGDIRRSNTVFHDPNLPPAY